MSEDTMRSSYFAMLLSCACLLLGTILLLVFMKYYTVPHVATSMFEPVHCHVTDICSTSAGFDDDFDLADHTRDVFGQYQASNTSVEDVKVMLWAYMTRNYPYVRLGSRRHRICSNQKENFHQIISSLKRQLIREQGSTETLTPVQLHNNTALRILSGYIPSLSPTVQAVSERTISRTQSSGCVNIVVNCGDQVQQEILWQDSKTYFDGKDRVHQCRCPHCHQDAATQANLQGHTTITINQTLTCSLGPGQTPHSRPQVIWRRTATIVIVNVMLWPTVLIIVGFVGMIFSWIYMQYGDETRDEEAKRKARLATHIEKC